LQIFNNGNTISEKRYLNKKTAYKDSSTTSYRHMGEWIHAFLTLALDAGEWSASGSSPR
jgi:hypothetical protein